MAAAGIVAIAVVGVVVVLLVTPNGNPAPYYDTSGNINNYPGVSIPTGMPPLDAPPVEENAAELDTMAPFECEETVPAEGCTMKITLRVKPPVAYYLEMTCGAAHTITTTVNGRDIYNYAAPLGWYHTVQENPQSSNTGYEEVSTIVRQFKEHDILPPGATLTCKPLGPAVPDSEFMPPADAQVSETPVY